MPYIQRDDAQVFFEIAGEGPPLLLIAGIASDIASWAPVAPLLAKNFQLIMFDNRGSGRTRDEGPINAADWVEDAISVLDNAKIEQAHVLGHSLGGMIGLRLAEKAPDRIAKLVAAATTANPEPKSAALMHDMALLYESGIPAEDWFRLLFHWLFAPPFFDKPQNVEQASQMAAAYEYCQSPVDFRRQVDAAATLQPIDVSTVKNKTLLLLAENDMMITPSVSRSSFAAAPNIRNVLIRGAGHSLHWDQPGAFAAAIDEFLKS